MTVAVVQSKTSTLSALFTGDGTGVLSFDAPTTVGNRVVVTVGTAQSSRDITSVVDDGAGGVNTYSEVPGTDLTTVEPSRSWIYISAALGAASTQITVTLASATAADASITLYEISGAHATTPIEDSSFLDNVGAASTTQTLPNVDAAAAGSLLLLQQWMTGTGSYTIDADFTQVYNHARGCGGWDQVNAGTFNAVITSAANESGQHVLLVIQPAAGAAAPVIVDVDEDNTVSQTQANVEIDGTDFDTAAVELRQGGFTYTPSIDSQNATAIVFDMPSLGATGPVDAPHAGAVTLAVVNGDDQEDTQAITVTDETDTETYLIGTPNADPDLRLTASADAVAGDYVRISNVQGGAITDVNVNSDLTWDADEAVSAFDVQYWDMGDGTWGDRETQTTADIEPDAFVFTDVTNVEPSEVQTSNTITVSGLDSTVDVTVTGGTYSKNGGSYVSSAGTANNGDTFAVRHTASASLLTATDTTLNIGSGSDTFTSTTRDTLPAFGSGSGRKRDNRRRGSILPLWGRG